MKFDQKRIQSQDYGLIIIIQCNNNGFIKRGGSVGQVQSSLRPLKQYLQTFTHKYTDIQLNTNKQKSSMPKVNYLLFNLDIHS